MFSINKPTFLTFTILSFYASAVFGAQSWPGPKGFPAPSDFKAFPTSDPCQMEVIFNATLKGYDGYSWLVHGLFEKAATPIECPAVENANYYKNPITVMNGSSSDYVQYPSGNNPFQTYVPLIVDICKGNPEKLKFQNKFIVEAVNGSSFGDKILWTSDPIQVTQKPILDRPTRISSVSVKRDPQSKDPKANLPNAYVTVQWGTLIDKSQIQGYYVQVGSLSQEPFQIFSRFIKDVNETKCQIVLSKYATDPTKQYNVAVVSVLTKDGSISNPIKAVQTGFDIVTN